MKKILMLSGLTAMMVSLVSVAYAASGTISLSPATKNVSPGQTVSVTVTVNPSAGSVYTVKAKIVYPANLLEVQSFTFSDGWLPLSQTGYDLTDNANGILIKTAGYGGGLSAPKVLGNISFKVKAAGTASVTVASDSLLLDASNGNAFSGSSGSTLTSAQATPTTTPTATPTPVIRGSVASPTPTASVSPVASAPVGEGQVVAAVAAGLSTGRMALYAGIALAAVIIAWLLVRRLRRKKQGIQQ